MPQGEELKGLIGALEAILTEQKETTHSLILSRSRVDLQLKEVFCFFYQCIHFDFLVFYSIYLNLILSGRYS